MQPSYGVNQNAIIVDHVGRESERRVDTRQREPKSVAQWIQQWTGIDITRCPACGHQPLERIPVPAALGAKRNRDPPAPTS
jgi:hypothetical protein